MSEQIITKTCSKCKEIKPVSEFHKDKQKKDGLCSSCSECCSKRNKMYRQSPKGKAVHRKAFSKWQKTEKGKRAMAKHRDKYPQRYKARKRVNDAIKSNRMLPASKFPCISCGEHAKEYHHHKGYSPEFHFDVIPVCKICHKSIHRKVYPITAH